MIRINLLPVRAAQKKERLRSQVMILALSVVLALAACVMVWLSLSSKVDSIRADIVVKNAEIARLKTAIGDVDRFKALKVELSGKLGVLAKLKANRSGPVRLLDELSQAVPEKIWINSFTEVAGSIKITGSGLTEEGVAEFLRRLEESSYYQNVELVVLEQKVAEGRDLQSFSLKCQVEAQSNPSK